MIIVCFFRFHCHAWIFGSFFTELSHEIRTYFRHMTNGVLLFERHAHTHAWQTHTYVVHIEFDTLSKKEEDAIKTSMKKYIEALFRIMQL